MFNVYRFVFVCIPESEFWFLSRSLVSTEVPLDLVGLLADLIILGLGVVVTKVAAAVLMFKVSFDGNHITWYFNIINLLNFC